MAGRVALLLLAAVLGTACAEAAPPSLEPGSAEAALPAAIWPADPSLVTDVACADLDPLIVAQTVTCTAVLDGSAVTAEVAIDEVGNATSTIEEPLFVVADAADELSARLMADLGMDTAPEVICERAVFLAEADEITGCRAARGTDSFAFNLRLLNAEGEWTLE